MALREYKCESCGLTEEVILPTSVVPAPYKVCNKCAGQSKYVEFSRFGFARSSFSEAPIDLMIGADADRRWTDYNDRIGQRNEVRKASGSLGLTEVHDGKFVPISDERKSERAHMYDVAERDGLPRNSEMDSIH